MPSPLAERIPTKRIAAFALRVGLYWAALALAWPLLAPIYRPVYCILGNVAFNGGEASAQYRVAKKIVRDSDIELVLTKRSPRVQAEAETSSRVSGYLPTIALTAFILATPISWARRRKALALGMVGVSLFVLMRMWLLLWWHFSRPSEFQVYDPGPFVRWFTDILYIALLNAPASWFIVPIFIWVGVAFRRSDWELLENDGAPAES